MASLYPNRQTNAAGYLKNHFRKPRLMNKPLSLALFCLLLPSFAHADDTDDERRRLLDEGSRQTRQYRESSWLGGQDAAAVEDDSGYINIDSNRTSRFRIPVCVGCTSAKTT